MLDLTDEKNMYTKCSPIHPDQVMGDTAELLYPTNSRVGRLATGFLPIIQTTTITISCSFFPNPVPGFF
jgi:hypothetical protein